jgi:protein subunit release factor B
MKSERAFSVTRGDCEWQYFRAGGKGGQNQNKTSSGVRVIHRPSGAIGESREHRTQLDNRRAAWRRMAESVKFRIWVNRELMRETPEQWVEKQMNDGNLKIEVRGTNGWEDGNL